MNKVRCAHCGCRFVPNQRIKNQRYCRKIECQRARKRLWQRQKLASDPDYQANKLDSQKAWRSLNSFYWKNWRARHPKYVERNRILQKSRRIRHRSEVAKMDALRTLSGIKTGSYYLVPGHLKSVAKMDVSVLKVRLILTA